MPSKGSRRRNASSHSLFDRRSVVAQINDGTGACCPCSLSLSLDQSKSPCRGNLALRFFAQFEGFDESQLVTLRLPLENLERVQHGYGNKKDVPSIIHDYFAQDNPIRTDEQVLTISIKMRATGCLIVPSYATVLTPKDNSRTAVHAFQRLCQSTEFITYVPANDISGIQKAALEKFNEMADQQGMLASMPVHLQRMYDGKGAREATWEIFDIPEFPPAYPQWPERGTNKRSLEASPILTPKRRAIDFSGSTEPRSGAYVSNTDTDTDFSAHAFSPLLAGRSPTGINTATRKEPSIPISADADLAHSAMRSMVHDALPNIVERALSEMLPTVLRTTVQEMLPQILHDAIYEHRPGVHKSYASDASQSITEQDRTVQYPFVGVMEPVVQQHLPAVVRKVMDDDGTYDDLIYQAQQQMEMVIEEEKENALNQVREERDVCVRDIQETGTNVRDMLESAGWDVDGERSPQAILEAIMRTVRSTISGESAQSDRLKFTRTRAERRRSASSESTKDVASTTDTVQTEGSLSTRASFSSTHDDSIEVEAYNESEDGQAEGNLSPLSTHSPSSLARLLGESPSLEASTRAQGDASGYGQPILGVKDKSGNTMSVGNGGTALGEEGGKEWEYSDLSPTQADSETEMTDQHVKGEAGYQGENSEC